MEPDYICSSALNSAWEAAGVPVQAKGASTTSNMYCAFIASCLLMYHLRLFFDGSGLAYGDVLLTPGRHTAMYIGNSQMVHASINENGTDAGE